MGFIVPQNLYVAIGVLIALALWAGRCCQGKGKPPNAKAANQCPLLRVKRTLRASVTLSPTTSTNIFTAAEEEIVDAMKLVWKRMKIVMEPSSAVPLATVLKNRHVFDGKRVGGYHDRRKRRSRQVALAVGRTTT
jgi:hypothetical protein